MAPSALAQRRTHNLLLFQKLLNLRDGASPFTLLLDSLEQSAKPVTREFILRAKISKTTVIFVSWQTLKKPKHVDLFIRARGKRLAALREEIASHVTIPPKAAESATSTKTLVIFDALNPACNIAPTELPTFLSGILSPTTSIVAVYHTDVPLAYTTTVSPYAPSPLITLLYLATAILRISSFQNEITRKKARDKSLPEPGFGMREGKEGVIIGLRTAKTVKSRPAEVVIEMEVRRKSGRGVRENFVLTPAATTTGILSAKTSLAHVTLLDDHPAFAAPVDMDTEAKDAGDDGPESTFSMGLTEKQRRDREGIVLPYFDAQKGEGPGEGGRILYEMGREDDFDEDEDDEF